jgi:hypothetical protein
VITADTEAKAKDILGQLKKKRGPLCRGGH